jgi:hypothetical protein
MLGCLAKCRPFRRTTLYRHLDYNIVLVAQVPSAIAVSLSLLAIILLQTHLAATL